jgi:hypothetical protein
MAALVTGASAPRIALAGEPTRLECAEAYASAQELRKSKKLKEAEQKVIVCAQASCPDAVRDECTRWLDEVRAEIPSVVIAAKRGDEDVVDVVISIDGAKKYDAVPADAVAMDPGTYKFKFEHRGQTIERSIVLRSGERLKQVTIAFEGSKSAPGGGEGGGGPVAPPPVTEDSGVGAGPWVLGGVGVLAVAGFGAFALMGSSQQSDLEGGCGKTKSCSPDDLDAVRQKYLIGDVLLGVGAAALIGAGVWFAVGSGGSGEKAPVALGVGPGSFSLRGAF